MSTQDEGREREMLYLRDSNGAPVWKGTREEWDRLRTPTAEPSEPVNRAQVLAAIREGFGLRTGKGSAEAVIATDGVMALLRAHPVPEDSESAEVERLKSAVRDAVRTHTRAHPITAAGLLYDSIDDAIDRALNPETDG